MGTAIIRRQNGAALLAATIGALAITAHVGLALARLRATGALPAEPGLAFLCSLVAAPLPAAGAALLPAALAVMAPCLLQIALALVAAAAGLAATSGRQLWPAGLAFAVGFLGIYGLAAAGVGLAGAALAEWAFLLRAGGGLLLAGLGLAVLRVLPRGALPGCRGPRWLILSGRASLRRPLGAGAAFAVYCLGCCGPYLAGLALLGAGAGAPARGAALIFGFALLMGALLLLPIVALSASRRLGQILARHAAPLALASGAALTALGAALALEPAVVWALAG